MAKTLSVLGSVYHKIAASETKSLGPGGRVGDYLSHIIINPATVTPGSVTIYDGAELFDTYSVGTLTNTAPLAVPIGMRSKHGGWRVTCGASVSAVATGTFTVLTEVTPSDVLAGAPIVDEPVITPEA